MLCYFTGWLFYRMSARADGGAGDGGRGGADGENGADGGDKADGGDGADSGIKEKPRHPSMAGLLIVATRQGENPQLPDSCGHGKRRSSGKRCGGASGLRSSGMPPLR